ncbi:MAG: DUF3549 family protein [Gammaproteobacteria bacterium]|nr:DUF3549 family protein [Gammaproteobacteria bacterium]
MHDKQPSLLRLLEDSGSRVLVYDIGRRISAIPRATFAAFEEASTPYPLPMQRKAWSALVQVGEGQPVIWFLRLALDEQGLLVQAERDYLLGRLLESAYAGRAGADPQQALRDNPQAFTPRDDRMALFHARLGADLRLPPSRFYEHALAYFNGEPGWDQWEFVGYQGIADVACRHTDEPLSAAIAQLPREPLVALCHCLESQTISTPLRDALLARLAAVQRQTKPDIGVIAGLVRGLSSHAGSAGVRGGLESLLATSSGRNIEVLAAISGRAWEALTDDLLGVWLEALAHNDHGQAAFSQCISDLLSLPSMAEPVRAALRSADRSAAARSAFAAMTATGQDADRT